MQAGGGRVTLDVQESYEVAQIFQKYAMRTGKAANAITLSFEGQPLQVDDRRTLADLNIQADSELVESIQVVGGIRR